MQGDDRDLVCCLLKVSLSTDVAQKTFIKMVDVAPQVPQQIRKLPCLRGIALRSLVQMCEQGAHRLVLGLFAQAVVPAQFEEELASAEMSARGSRRQAEAVRI